VDEDEDDDDEGTDDDDDVLLQLADADVVLVFLAVAAVRRKIPDIDDVLILYCEIPVVYRRSRKLEWAFSIARCCCLRCLLLDEL
jgi:hypothetical protein